METFLPALDTYMPTIIRIAQALAVLVVGWVFSRWVARLITARLGNQKGLQINDTLRPLFVTFARYAIMLATLYAALTVAKVPAASLLAVLSAAGLAIALAVQGTLSNIAAGIMLIFLRSLKVGDYITTPSLEGSVSEVGLFTTQIRGSSGVLITAPNSEIWRQHITNYSRNDERRIDINLELSRDNDLEAALKTVRATLLKSPHIVKPDTASVALTLIKPTSANVQARCWISASDVRGHTSDINLDLHNALRKGEFKLPPVMPLHP